MTSITSWTRLEPITQNDDIKPALQARIFDPVWMLTRQWQVGEFQGEDAGSPIVTKIDAECALLSRVQPGNAETAVTGMPYNPKVQPLEPFIECESVCPLSDSIEGLVQSAEAGQHFLRLLGIELEKKYRSVLVNRFARPAIDQFSAKENSDPNGLRFLRIMTGRVPNGAKLMLAYRQNELISQFDTADVNIILPIAEAWSKWYNALFVKPDDQTQTAWSSERMEYAFSIAAPTDIESPSETVLCAREYFDGHPDWYDFQYRQQSSLGAIQDHRANNPNSENPFLIEQSTIPAPVTYPGMPAMRWWEFEDADVNFGAVESAPDELIRMLMVAFAVSYANDWFVVPLELPVGSLCHIKSLVVTDTFGVKSLIPSSKATTESGISSLSSSWRMFELSEDRVNSVSTASASTKSDLFFLPPTLLIVSESKPLEDVLILRDEMANLAWAIE
ncbi:MAG: hypothetical protein IPN42_11325 [Methylococcaceae bacterium]|nr:hypothetical protein [Methylococcaceae bacterium]